MSTVVLDTNVVSFLMKGHRLADGYRPYIEGRRLAISFMTVGELYEGACRAGWGRNKLHTTEGERKDLPGDPVQHGGLPAVGNNPLRTSPAAYRRGRRLDRGHRKGARLAADHP